MAFKCFCEIKFYGLEFSEGDTVLYHSWVRILVFGLRGFGFCGRIVL